MKIDDLLIDSVVLESMLLESYKDFSRQWKDLLDGATTPNKSKLMSVPLRIEKLLRDNRSKSIFGNDDFLRNYVTQRLNVRNPLDASSWVAGLRETSRIEGTARALAWFSDAIRIVEDRVEAIIKERTPAYSVVKKTSGYIIFEIENFAAAQKLRNQVRASWCIGSTPEYFDNYGKDMNRKTFYLFLLKSKSAMVFHVASNGSGLITSHDNYAEWVIRAGRIRTERGMRDYTTEILGRGDATVEEVREIHKALGIPLPLDLEKPDIPSEPLNNMLLRMRNTDQTSITVSFVSMVNRDYKRIYESGDTAAIAAWMTRVSEEVSTTAFGMEDVKDLLSGIHVLDAISYHIKDLMAVLDGGRSLNIRNTLIFDNIPQRFITSGNKVEISRILYEKRDAVPALIRAFVRWS